MFQSISWSQYLTCLFLVIFIYYFIITLFLLLYHGKYRGVIGQGIAVMLQLDNRYLKAVSKRNEGWSS